MAITSRSRFSTAIACGLIVAASIVSTSTTAITTGAANTIIAISDAWRWVTDLVLAPFKVAAAAVVKNLPGPALALIAAKQYLTRQVKREKPQLSPSWRMCPSA
jgi:hypothetical protein